MGIASSGVHSNGFSLVRKILEDNNLYDEREILEWLLTPTKIYVKQVLDVIRQCEVHAVCHITGGGFDENIPRVLKEGQSVEIKEGTWTVLPVFRFLEEKGNIPHREMFNIFNMGIGMIVVIPENEAEKAQRILTSYGEESKIIGKVIKGNGKVEIV